MSFSATKHRAQDINRHINARRVAVRSCIQLCSCYTGLNGFQAIVGYFNLHHNLNGDDLSSENIDSILEELTELRERSKQIRSEYIKHRKEEKGYGRRKISNKELIVWKENWKKITHLWDKFESEENRQIKELLYAKIRTKDMELMKKRK